jgi:DNA-binding MarR family transcriptional regulator
MEQDHVDRLTERWELERPELDTGPLSITARIVRLQRVLDRRTSQVLAPLELTIGEANVLATLRRAGEPYELTPTELYRGLLVSSGAMTNRLDQLESRGLLVRRSDPDDRRRVRVALTDRGRALVDAAMDAETEALAELLGFLSDEERATLIGLLRTVLVRLGDDDVV